MKKILFVTTVSNMLTAFLLPFSDFFKNQGWQVEAMASGVQQNDKCLQHFDKCWNLNLSRNLFQLKNYFFEIRKVQDLILSQHYDLIHVHTPIAAFIVRYAMRKIKNRPKIIYTAHGFHFHPNGALVLNAFFKAIEKIAGRWTDGLITINQYDFITAQKMKIVPIPNIYFVPGIGVDIRNYNAHRVSDEEIMKVRRALNLTKDEKILLMVGEFTSQKRQHLAVIALSQIKTTNLHLVFAGEGQCVARVKSLAKRLSLENRVHFLGHRADIITLMKASSIILSLSKREGLPRCLLEAMAMGLPIIGFDIRGVSDLLKQNAGYLVKSGDVKALVKAIETVLSDENLQKRMIENGLREVVQYDINTVLKSHEVIYQQILM